MCTTIINREHLWCQQQNLTISFSTQKSVNNYRSHLSKHYAHKYFLTNTYTHLLFWRLFKIALIFMWTQKACIFQKTDLFISTRYNNLFLHKNTCIFIPHVLITSGVWSLRKNKRVHFDHFRKIGCKLECQ